MFPESSKSGPTSSGKSKAKVSFRSTPNATKANKGKAARKDDSDHDDEEVYSDEDLEGEEEEEPDTDEEIHAAQAANSKSKKTAKRKRRATSPTSFGMTLEGLLGISTGSSAQSKPSTSSSRPGSDSEGEEGKGGLDDQEEEEETTVSKAKRRHIDSISAPSGASILSLAPHLRRSAQSQTLNARAARIALEQRRKREEKARVKDVIGGWGPPGVLPEGSDDEDGEGSRKSNKVGADEDPTDVKMMDWINQGGSTGYERRLRKVAQRGVVKLFNAIRAAQTTTTSDLEDEEDGKSEKTKKYSTASSKGSSEVQAKLAAETGLKGLRMSKRDNPLGGKEAALADLSKSNFLDLIRRGTGKVGQANA
ncbi:hypothetical protein IE53DRAFT_389926 [Violaceomyces palustris]|uniref:Uncharacterized protein n=1 Tax=Violaceomyces palustris TaxID=1673888 RepID=A0ACD0NQ13_9BASI|nr:hypothetical protein IE53DRAFT_389926 [Violaceomyces palustris]